VDFPGNGAASGEKLVFSMKHPEFSMEYGDFFLRNLVKNHRLVKQKPIQQAKLEI
jgi:predicted PP-loop superfamily ATPase